MVHDGILLCANSALRFPCVHDRSEEEGGGAEARVESLHGLAWESRTGLGLFGCAVVCGEITEHKQDSSLSVAVLGACSLRVGTVGG